MQAEKIIAPVPHYAMPDHSEPPYEKILDEMQEQDMFPIGSSYFYLRSYRDRFELCRILYGGGKIFFHEIVGHEKLGISDEDMELSARAEREFAGLSGHFSVSPLIENKLRLIYDR